jgi:hypothetical protein
MRHDKDIDGSELQHVRTEPRDRARRSPVFEIDQRVLVDEGRRGETSEEQTREELNMGKNSFQVGESSNHSTREGFVRQRFGQQIHIELQCSLVEGIETIDSSTA